MGEKVAVIIANYNGEKVIKSCVESLNRMNYENLDIVVVDDCSTDNSISLIKKLPNVTLLSNRKNRGFAVSNNRGMRYALSRGAEYVLLLNNDTVVDVNMLNELLRRANTNTVTVPIIYYFKRPNVIWCAGGELDKYDALSHNGATGKHESRKSCKERKVSFACGCCLLIHKDILKKVGLLSEDYYMYCEDTDFSWKLQSAGINILFIPNAKVWHKVQFSVNQKDGKLLYCYYFCRNNLMIIKRYGQTYKNKAYVEFILNQMKEFPQMTLLERKGFILGIIDFFFGIHGKRDKF